MMYYYRILYFLAIAVSSALGVSLYETEVSSGLRISNGTNSGMNQFPYAVSLQANDAASQALAIRGHRCGGVLVTLQHVLTTASCLYNVGANGVPMLINPANFQIFGGAVTLDAISDRIRAIANFTVHPDFVGAPTHLNDIAIVTLVAPFARRTVVPLPVPSTDWQPKDFTVCTVAGWGATAINAQTNPTQQYAEKYIYNQNLCATLYSGLAASPNVFPKMVCAASFNIISSGCTGDIGNALVCDGTLTGLLFHHNNCISTCYPELYTRVSDHTAWIQSITGSSANLTPTVSMILLFTISQMLFTKVVN